ncbi:MAG: hydroxymethylpyrimidine/phosphomethylpyrimidine kinase [Halomonas sp.]|uniref:bifunctional hydroxymethylpyrimidine kinase/phosphomethylpyrimidine kinase n=1 Tax=unclassified Halomonas TaxID=2609666 RepID=UPI0009906B66|nr:MULTISPECIES: hydroxymethylpyrimidine/phosphomethylpyrimidine kinase [unclassified Halomonas]AQU84487.1 hydroxymethylpyrimidine/phosphomethylpyrimidine kinase [Halomonas sp. 'Soap Lake \
MRQPLPPVVLVLAGHDPTGGAGLVADSEAIAACGGWAATIPTALTVQNCHDVMRILPADPNAMRQMAEALGDMQIAAIKLGLLADEPTLRAAEQIIRRFPGVPVVADPVLKAGGGAELSTPRLQKLYVDRLLPLVDILTPNRYELAMLTPEITEPFDDTARAVALLSQGCQAVLVTATDDPMPGNVQQVVHTLHSPDTTRQWQWPRLPDVFHGSGCTLASALAARLAVGERLPTACEQAQHFTWECLSQGYQPPSGQCLPNRLPHPGRF